MDRNDPLHVKPVFRPRSARRAPLLDEATGLPALANLSHDAGVAVIAGILARIASGDDSVLVLAGADPKTGRPVWAVISESGDEPDAVEVRCYDGHPDEDEDTDGGGIAEGALAAVADDSGSADALLAAASFVYDLVVRETT
jgi:hypothetical protein